MVNWKDHESTNRLLAALIAAHPNLKLDYQTIALFFGQNATYDSIEGRLRRSRKEAEDLKSAVQATGVDLVALPARRGGSSTTTPRTPRGPRGITKSNGSSSGKMRGGSTSSSRISRLGSSSARKLASACTPTRGGSIMDAICLDENEEINGREIVEVQVKVKNEDHENGDIEILVDEKNHGKNLVRRLFANSSDRRVDSRSNGYVVDACIPGSSSTTSVGDGGNGDEVDIQGLYFSNDQDASYDMDDLYGVA